MKIAAKNIFLKIIQEIYYISSYTLVNSRLTKGGRP